ncbi:MAG: hypothetical protein GEV03_20050 [Streptosporangiales bacterium]|nr:hypothetical protein [Streptosporangiales bacterium]
MNREVALTVAAGVMNAVVTIRVMPIRLVLLIGGLLVGVLAAVLGIALDAPAWAAVVTAVAGALAVIAGLGVWLFERVLRGLIRLIAPPRAVPTEMGEALQRAGIPAGPVALFRFLRRARRNPEGMRGEVLATMERVRDLPQLIDDVAPAEQRAEQRAEE